MGRGNGSSYERDNLSIYTNDPYCVRPYLTYTYLGFYLCSSGQTSLFY